MLEHLEKPKPLLAVAQQDGGRQSNVCTVFLDPVPGLASTPSTLVLVSLVHPQHFFCGFSKLGFPDLWNNQLGEGGGTDTRFPFSEVEWDSDSGRQKFLGYYLRGLIRLHTLGSLSINIGRPMIWLSNTIISKALISICSFSICKVAHFLKANETSYEFQKEAVESYVGAE